jgi:hypothetical protein
MTVQSNPGAAPLAVDSPVYDCEAANVASVDYVPAVPCRGIYVGTSGNVSIVTPGGNTTVFTNVLGGTILPVAFTKITHVNTTASNLVALA